MIKKIRSGFSFEKSKIPCTVYFQFFDNDRVITCTIEDHVFDVDFIGKAKCNYSEGDTFDLKYGMLTAYTRAAAKRIKGIIRLEKEYKRLIKQQEDFHNALDHKTKKFIHKFFSRVPDEVKNKVFMTQ